MSSDRVMGHILAETGGSRHAAIELHEPEVSEPLPVEVVGTLEGNGDFLAVDRNRKQTPGRPVPM